MMKIAQKCHRLQNTDKSVIDYNFRFRGAIDCAVYVA
jgi:hypothetical protein